MDIWRYVRHPDNSLALAHVYDENVEIVVPILPRPDPEAGELFFKPRAWRWFARLTLVHFFALLGCAHFVHLPLIAFAHMILSLAVGMTVNGQYTPVFFFINYSVPFEEGIIFFVLSSKVNACLMLLANDLKHDSIMWWLLSP